MKKLLNKLVVWYYPKDLVPEKANSIDWMSTFLVWGLWGLIIYLVIKEIMK